MLSVILRSMRFRLFLSLFLALVVQAFSQECSYHTLAGFSVTFGGDSGPVTQALFNAPSAVSVARDGTIYIADTGNHRVRRIDPDGTVHPVAGTGEIAFTGDGGPAQAAALRSPRGVAVAPDGTVYIADSGNHRIRKVLPDGIIETFAGNGKALFNGDEGPAIAASLNKPTQLALDAAGALYILDSANVRIRRVDKDGIIRTVAGASPLSDYRSGSSDPVVDGMPAAAAGDLSIYGFGVAPDGTLYINDGVRIWRVGSDGLLRLWLAFLYSSPEQNLVGPVPLNQLIIGSGSVVVGPDGTVYLNTNLQLLAVRDGVATRVSDSLSSRNFAIDPVSGGIIAVFPFDLIRQAPDGSRTVLWADPSNAASPPSPTVDSPIQPQGIAVGPDGTIYIAESYRILTLNHAGQLQIFAGSLAGSTVDGTPALNARLSSVRSLAVDSNGTVYFAEPRNSRVRKIGPDGILRTVFTTQGQPVWVRTDGQNRLYVFIAQRDLSQLVRYDPDGKSTVLMTDVHGGGIFWTSVSGPDSAPGMAVAKDGTVYLGFVASLGNSASTVFKISPDKQSKLVPMQENIDSSALAVGDDAALYLATTDGVIKKVLSDGTMVTFRNRDHLGFWGEHGVDSEPLLQPRIYDLAIDGRGGLLAVDSSVRMVSLGCAVEPGPALVASVESATSNTNRRVRGIRG